MIICIHSRRDRSDLWTSYASLLIFQDILLCCHPQSKVKLILLHLNIPPKDSAVCTAHCHLSLALIITREKDLPLFLYSLSLNQEPLWVIYCKGGEVGTRGPSSLVCGSHWHVCIRTALTLWSFHRYHSCTEMCQGNGYFPHDSAHLFSKHLRGHKWCTWIASFQSLLLWCSSSKFCGHCCLEENICWKLPNLERKDIITQNISFYISVY